MRRLGGRWSLTLRKWLDLRKYGESRKGVNEAKMKKRRKKEKVARRADTIWWAKSLLKKKTSSVFTGGHSRTERSSFLTAILPLLMEC